MINPAAASCFYNSKGLVFFFPGVECFIFKPVENTLNLFLISISLKTRYTLNEWVGGCVCVSEIPTMLLPRLAHCVFQQQQKENQLRQILLGRMLYMRLITI